MVLCNTSHVSCIPFYHQFVLVKSSILLHCHATWQNPMVFGFISCTSFKLVCKTTSPRVFYPIKPPCVHDLILHWSIHRISFRVTMPRCNPWCWNIKTYITGWFLRGSHVAVHIPAPTMFAPWGCEQKMGLSENVGLIFPMIASHFS